MKARSKAFLILILSLSFCLFSFFSFSSFSSSPLLSTTNIHAHALPPPPRCAPGVGCACGGRGRTSAARRMRRRSTCRGARRCGCGCGARGYPLTSSSARSRGSGRASWRLRRAPPRPSLRPVPAAAAPQLPPTSGRACGKTGAKRGRTRRASRRPWPAPPAAEEGGRGAWGALGHGRPATPVGGRRSPRGRRPDGSAARRKAERVTRWRPALVRQSDLALTWAPAGALTWALAWDLPGQDSLGAQFRFG